MNACGIDDFHDGVNYTRTACVIAVSKARDMFEPFLHQVGSGSSPMQIDSALQGNQGVCSAVGSGACKGSREGLVD